MSDSDYCGWPTSDGSACEHPASDDETGRCWQHTDNARTGGRPSKFDDERARQAVRAAREAKSKAGCARAALVDKHTLHRWLEKNPTFETQSGDREQFRNAFSRARSEGERVLLQGGLRNDDIDSGMARFILSTSYGYVKTERKEHLVDDDADFDEDTEFDIRLVEE